MKQHPKKLSHPGNRPNTAIISDSNAAFEIFKTDFQQASVEEFWILALSRGLHLIEKQMLFRGTADSCPAHPRDVYRFACLTNAVHLIVAHNHPSQELLPSWEDLLFTQKLIRAGGLLQIPLVDHLLVSNHIYESFADNQWICFKTGRINVHL